jgi:hypothetical protein
VVTNRQGQGLSRSIRGERRDGLVRLWDLSTAARVDHFVANSGSVASRIRKYSRRESRGCKPAGECLCGYIAGHLGDHYLVVSRLPDKRVDAAIETCNRLQRPLPIVVAERNTRR